MGKFVNKAEQAMNEVNIKDLFERVEKLEEAITNLVEKATKKTDKKENKKEGNAPVEDKGDEKANK